jgi:hypothetical protein
MKSLLSSRSAHMLVVTGLFAGACGPRIEADDAGADAGTSTGPVAPTSGATAASSTAGSSVTEPTGTTTGDELGDDSSTGLVFPDPCSTLEQDCPAGYKCMPWANNGGNVWNDTKCVLIVDGPRVPGESCTVVGSRASGEDDCDGTSMCWDVNPRTNTGVCQPFCIGTHDEPTCTNPCDDCVQSGDGVNLCFSACDPLLQSCDPGLACYPVLDSFVCAPVAGDLVVGSPCEFINVCPSGTTCIDAVSVPGCAGIGCCAPYCPVGGADPCPGLLPGTSCVPWFDEPGQGPPEQCIVAPVGVCVQ